jgi:hypothetical protein
LLAGIDHSAPQLLLDQRRQRCHSALGCPGDVEALAQLHLRHEQEHHHRGQAWPLRRTRSVARLKPLSWPVCLLYETGSPSTTRSDGPLGRGTNRSDPNRCSGKVFGLVRLPSVPFLGAFSVGIARKAPVLAPGHRALTERADDPRRFGVDRLAAPSFWFG